MDNGAEGQQVINKEAFLRRTKIVATLGPATDDPAVLAEMMRAGLDVARINFSHGGKDEQRRRIVAIRAAAEAVGRPIGILADLSGPKIRIESFQKGRIVLFEGQPFALDIALDPAAGNEREVGCAYKDLIKDVKAGDTPAAGRWLHRAGSAVGAGHAHRVHHPRRRRAFQPQGPEQAGRRPLGSGAHREGPRIHPARRRDERGFPGGFLRARCPGYPPRAGRAAQVARHGARGGQDRAPRGHRQSQRHPLRGRCRHGRPRRPGRRNGLRRTHRPAEDHHRAGAAGQPHRHHRDAEDDGVHDPQPRCPRAPRSAMWPMPCSTAPTP